jgi:hypothetical protein
MSLRSDRAPWLAYLFFCLSLGVPAGASAQPRTVLVLPWSLADADAATLAARAESVAGAISTGDLSAISIADARTRFEEHGSAEPPTMSDSDLDHWLALSRLAVRHLAHADYAAAAATLREAQALSEPAAAELNREESRARQVLDTCLYDVRGLVETEDPRAEARALECRRLVPRIAPSPYQHTPEVVELMTRIDRRLAAAPPGSLRLESVPTGCRVRLNGILLGETPFISEDLATGEYRAQIECGAEGEAPTHRGRIHRIRLSEGASTVRIDVRFDSSVRTDTALRLVYASQAEADGHRLEDAVTAASTIGAGEVWLVSPDATDADVIRIDRVRVSDSVVLASVRTHASSELPGAVAAVSRGASEDRTGATPAPMAVWGAREGSDGGSDSSALPQAASAGRADWEIWMGIGLGAVGIGGYVTSFVLVSNAQGYGHLATQPLITDPDYLSRRDQWTSRELPALAVGWAGGLLVTAALPFVMSDEAGTPWWSWVIGGVGLAAVGAGVAIALTAPTCGINRPTDACVAGTALADDGSAIASLGAPLLAVPFVYLIRDAIGGHAPVIPSASVSTTGASLSLGGTW